MGSNLTVRDVHVDRYLSAAGVAYMQDPELFICQEICPVVLVDKESDLYPVWNKADMMRDEAALRSVRSESARGGVRLSSGSYKCAQWSYGDEIYEQVRRNADPEIDLELISTKTVAHKLALRNERLCVAAIFGTGIWGATPGDNDVTGVASGPTSAQAVYWDASGSNPCDDVIKWCDNVQKDTGRRPNTLTLSPSLFRALNDNSDVLDRIKYVRPGFVSEVDLVEAFKLGPQGRVFVARSSYATSAEAATFAGSYVWTADAALLSYVPRTKANKWEPSACYTFAWKAYSDATGMAVIEEVKTNREKAYDVIDGSIYVDHKVVASDLGVYFTGMLTP